MNDTQIHNDPFAPAVAESALPIDMMEGATVTEEVTVTEVKGSIDEEGGNDDSDLESQADRLLRLPEFQEAQANPESAEAQFKAAEALWANSFRDAALQLVFEAAKIDHDNPLYHYRAAEWLLEMDNPGLACMRILDAIELDPDNPEYLELNDKINSALEAETDVRLADELVELTEYVALNPDDANAQWRLALALNGNGQFEEALAYSRRAFELFPDYLPCLIETYLGLGLFAEAKAVLGTEQRRDPINTNFHRLAVEITAAEIGITRCSCGKYTLVPEEGLLTCSYCHREHPGIASVEKVPTEDEVDPELAMLEASAARFPEDPEVQRAYAHALREADQPERAIGIFRLAARLDPSNGHLSAQVAWTALELGRVNEAQYAVEQALRVEPFNPEFIDLEREIAMARDSDQDDPDGTEPDRSDPNYINELELQLELARDALENERMMHAFARNIATDMARIYTEAREQLEVEVPKLQRQLDDTRTKLDTMLQNQSENFTRSLPYFLMVLLLGTVIGAFLASVP